MRQYDLMHMTTMKHPGAEDLIFRASFAEVFGDFMVEDIDTGGIMIFRFPIPSKEHMDALARIESHFARAKQRAVVFDSVLEMCPQDKRSPDSCAALRYREYLSPHTALWVTIDTRMEYADEDYRDARYFTFEADKYVELAGNGTAVNKKWFSYCCDRGDRAGMNVIMAHQHSDMKVVRSSALRVKGLGYAASADQLASPALREIMLGAGCSEGDFRPVRAGRNDEIVLWQIAPQSVLQPLAGFNGWTTYAKCGHCGTTTHYDLSWRPFLIPKSLDGTLPPLSRTAEGIGIHVQPEFIVTRELFAAMRALCPQKLFRPCALVGEGERLPFSD